MDKATHREKFRALLATGRVANLPTVWSNVIVAFGVGSYLISYSTRIAVTESVWLYPMLLVCALLATSAIYLAGCMLGDAKDLDFDRQHRPERPIPRGILSASKVAALSYVMFGLALLIVFTSTYVSALTDWFFRETITVSDVLSTLTDKSSLVVIQLHELIVACALCLCVIIYAHFHKRSRFLGLSLISASRLLLVIFAVSVTHKTFLNQASGPGSSEPLQLQFQWLQPWVLYFALAVGFHTLLLSWVASTESSPSLFTKRKLLACLMLLNPLVALLFNAVLPKYFYDVDGFGWSVHAEDSMITVTSPHVAVFILCLLIYYAWLAYAFHGLMASKPAFVSRALAGFCLLDACFAATFSAPVALLCIGLFALALLLQRFAPAT